MAGPWDDFKQGQPAGPWDDYKPASDANAPGMWESLGRGAAEGATFGLDSKLGLDAERRELSRRTNPVSHFVGEIAGGVLPMAAATLLPTGAGQVAAGARAAQMAARGAGLLRSALVPGEINTAGQAFKQGLKLGTVYSGLSGAGHADVKPEDTYGQALYKRGEGALTGAAEGAVLGPFLGLATHGLYRGAQGLGAFKAQARGQIDPSPVDIPGAPPLQAGALRTLTRKLEQDRITPQELIDNMAAGEFPSPSPPHPTNPGQFALNRRYWPDSNKVRQPITQAHVEEVVERASRGETAAQISAAMKAANGGEGPGRTVIQSMLDELAERKAGPINLVDRAAMVRPGSGENTQWAMRAAAATPGEHLPIIREGLLERQTGAGERLIDQLQRFGGNFDDKLAEHQDTLRSAARTLYGAAENTWTSPQANLQKILDDWSARYGERSDVVSKGIMRGVQQFLSERGAPSTMEEWMYARQGLRQLRDEQSSVNPLTGKREYTPLGLRYNELYRELTKAAGEKNPDWQIANQLFSGEKGVYNAGNAGANMSLRLGANSRENLVYYTQAQQELQRAQQMMAASDAILKRAAQGSQEYINASGNRMAAEARAQVAAAKIDLFKSGLTRKLSDEIVNQGDTHDLTRRMLTGGAKQNLQAIFGDDYPALLKTFEAERAMHRTYKSQFGAQTTPLREAVEELNWAPRFEASWHNLGFGKLLQLAQEYAARHINTRRNTALMQLYSDTDALSQLRTLRAAQRLGAIRNNWGNRAGYTGLGLGTSALSGALGAVDMAGRPLPQPVPFKP